MIGRLDVFGNIGWVCGDRFGLLRWIDDREMSYGRRDGSGKGDVLGLADGFVLRGWLR